MIFYKAVCSVHQYESNLYTKKSDAVKRANEHYDESSGLHDVKVLEVYVPDNKLKIVSEMKIEK